MKFHTSHRALRKTVFGNKDIFVLRCMGRALDKREYLIIIRDNFC